MLLTVQSIDLAHALVARGLGYALLMSRPGLAHIAEDGTSLRVTDLAGLSPRARLMAAWQRGNTLPPRALAMIDFASRDLSR